MCGFVGFYNSLGLHASQGEYLLTLMRDRLMHRGPDDGASWLDAEAGIALSHRRLSVVDLSPAGHQPMISSSGRYILAYNGEIYNHLHLRSQLHSTSSSWLGHSDTETLLAAIELWGIEKALQASVGMFAFALWDRQDRVLSLARDRLGEKPLYYGWQKGVLLFGSELKALRAHPHFEAEINRAVLPLYFRDGYIPAPWSIWKGISKLQPGTWVSFSSRGYQQTPDTKTYWSLADIARKGQAKLFKGSETDCVNALERLLVQSIAGQRLADVPLGAFLSGGVDSSVVVALMQSQSSSAVKTFTIGFEEAGFNEAEHASAVAKHLSTDHTELYVTSDQAQRAIPLLPQIYDEPFGDSSGIPTYLVSQLAKEHVTVALSGDGGDELFGGYSRYSDFHLWYKRMSCIPSGIRSLMSACVRNLSVPATSSTQRRIALLSEVLAANHPISLYQALACHWLPSDDVVQGIGSSNFLMKAAAYAVSLSEPSDFPMFADMMTYLPDDILVKVDRAAMANSLETRVPLLDHRIVEWTWTLPQSLKSRGGHHKWVLRHLLYRYVPKELIERPKMGFGVPIGEWLRGPLRAWAEDLLDPFAMKRVGLLNPTPVQKKWREHLACTHNWQYHLWDVLMFQAWLREQDL
jgi:asparagine synthase (glutamine-hydrolysing)